MRETRNREPARATFMLLVHHSFRRVSLLP